MKEETSPVRVRIAPSPTGFPHIGTIYQALFNYSFSKKRKGKFIVRIEDTDRERFVQGAEEKIYQALDWFGLPEEESPRKEGSYGPYRQSERLEIYKKYAEELVAKGHAYYCFCTRERLEEVRKKQQLEKKPLMYDQKCRIISKDEREKFLKENKPFVIRLKVPENKTIVVRDEIRGDISFDSNLIDDQVLIKSDGYPTYHLAVVVDDYLMEISHVVRAEEWLSSTPKHFILYDFFGWKKPLFFHTPTLRNPDRSKISKRHGHANVDWYIKEGFLKEAILNFLALLGWNSPINQEIFSLNQFIENFDLKNIRPVAPVFDVQKLEWMNGIYIRNAQIEKLQIQILELYPELKEKLEESTLLKIISLAQSRMNKLSEFPVLIRLFIEERDFQLNDQEKRIAEKLLSLFEKIIDWKKDEIFKVIKNILAEEKIKMPLIYKILTGEEKGLPLPETLEIIGKEKTVKNLKNKI